MVSFYWLGIKDLHDTIEFQIQCFTDENMTLICKVLQINYFNNHALFCTIHISGESSNIKKNCGGSELTEHALYLDHQRLTNEYINLSSIQLCQQFTCTTKIIKNILF